MSPQEILQAVYDKVQAGWTQRTYARNARGMAVPSNDPSAICWCLSGAMNTAPFYMENWREAHRRLLVQMKKRGSDTSYRGTIISWNDAEERTQQEVLDLIKDAKEMTE